MHASNSTSVAQPIPSYPIPSPQPPADSLLAGAQVRNSPTAKRFQLLEQPCTANSSGVDDPPSAIDSPVYCARLNKDDVPDFLKDGAVFDQPSLEKLWQRSVEQLQTQSVSDQEALEILESGILQTPTGKAIAPLLVDALMLSIRPNAGLTPERSREYVEIICHLPPENWANAFGENVNFPRGFTGEGVHGFIQKQLMASRHQRDEKIASGELLEDDTWKVLRDLTQLIEFDEFLHVRPSPKDAKALMAEFIKYESEQRPREDWPEVFSTAVQQIEDLLAPIKIVDNRPDRSLLEEIVDPEALKQTLSTLATPMNSALNVLGSQSLSAIGAGLLGAISEVTEKTTHYLAFGTGVESPFTAQTELMSALLEIEKKSSFFGEVDTSGPRYTGGFWGKVLYVANALNTVGILQVAETIKPHLTAVPTQALVSSDSPVPVPVEETAAYINGRVAQLEAEVNEFIASIDRRSESGAEDAIGAGLERPVATPATAEADENTPGHWTRSISEVLGEIDKFLTFPSASASNIEALLPQDEERLQAFTIAEHEEAPHPYLSTTEPFPARKALAEQWYTTLAQLSTVLARYGSYALGSAVATARLVQDNPNTAATAAFVAASAIYNEFNPAEPHEDRPLIPESPALHQERIDDAIANILETPIDSRHSTLSEAILELMYESGKDNLLDDPALIRNVALLLDQPSKQAPDNTYVMLIEAALAQTHAKRPAAQPKEISLDASLSIKHSANAAHENPEPQPAEVSLASFEIEEIEETEETEVSDATPESRVSAYLKTMDERPISDIEFVEDIENETPVAEKMDAAKHAIHLLRSRRSVGWMDASRASGDSELATRYATTLVQAAQTTNQGADLSIVIPSHSTFGRCWLNFLKAVQNPFFQEWVTRNGLILSTATVNVEDSSISIVDGSYTRRRYVLTDTGWANVAGPLLTAAKVLDPLGQGVKYNGQSFNAPFALVADFYGETRPRELNEAQLRAATLNEKKAFNDIKIDDPLRPLELRSEEVLKSQAQRVGDVYTVHALVTALNAYLKDKAETAPVDLNSVPVAAHPDSSFSVKFPAEAKTTVTARRLINANGWTEPKNKAEASNLVNALSFRIAENPRLNYWGACDYPRPLTAAQQNTIIRETADTLSTTGHKGLLDYLLHDQDVAEASQTTALNLALDSEKGKRFGETLVSKLGALSTPTSAAEWLMAALVLDLHPLEGSKRNHVAGYNLTQEANWGLKPSAVIGALENHLAAKGKVSATTAPYAARHLLSGIAPEFLVRHLPDNLVCGSHTWAMFRIAVNRIEQLSSGSSSRMTFEQVMLYGDTSPISVGQEVAVQMASVNPLIDWAVAQGVVKKTGNDIYSRQQLEIAREKFQQVREELGRAQNYLTAKTPTRKDIALAELTRVYGPDVPFERLALRNKDIPNAMRPTSYSMLDLYITGELIPGKYKSLDSAVPIHKFEKRIPLLKKVEPLFEKKFTAFFDGLREGSRSVFKHLVSQLSLEDRQNLEYGEQTYYTLRSEIDVSKTRQTPEQIAAAKGRHGLLIRSVFQGKTAYYEVFPSAVTIRKRTDLPDELSLGGRLAVSRSSSEPGRYKEVQRGTEQKFDWEAYKTGAVPREGVTSKVIIEKITPVTLYARFYPSGYDFNTVPNAFSPTNRIDYIASVVVDEHFVTGREALHALAKGSTASEDEDAFKHKVKDFFLGLIPFKSCIENIIKGDTVGAALDCTLDAGGFVVPGITAVGRSAQVLKSGGRVLPKAIKLTMISTGTLVTSANPFDGMGDIARFGKNAVCTLGTVAYSAASKGIDQLKGLYGCTKAIDSADLLKHADIAQGVCDAGTVAGQTTRVTARFKEGKWYAYDVAENRAYGPPLENFKLDSAIALESTTFGDGSSAYTNSKLFTEEPHTLQRSSGVDIVVGDKVYRFDPKLPNELNEITSPAYFKDLEGFDAVCSRGGKSKKAITSCLSKTISSSGSIEQKRVQAIEHKRLYPTKGANQRVVHERRVYTVEGVVGDARPTPLNELLIYKSETTGSLINDKHFGLPSNEVDAVLEETTRVVRVNDVVHGIEDMRDVMGFLVDIPGTFWGKTTYLVTEPDTGVFYYSHFDKNKSTDIKLTKLDFNEHGFSGDLINAFHKTKDAHLTAAGFIPNNDFLALPTLSSMYKKLEATQGFTPEKLDELKQKIELFSDEKKREFIISAWNKGNMLGIEVFIPAIKIEPIAKPPGFGGFSESTKNRVYAAGAKTQVDDQFTATGLGSFNKQIPNDPQDVLRMTLTQPVVVWQYSRTGYANFADMILKTGAGNCDHMAYVAFNTIVVNGGTASLWRVPGHTFTVSGVPLGTSKATVDFSEVEFKDAWVVDPWADIICSANEYVTKLREQMTNWKTANKMILTTDWGVSPPKLQWMEPTDERWMSNVIDGPKTPINVKPT